MLEKHKTIYIHKCPKPSCDCMFKKIKTNTPLFQQCSVCPLWAAVEVMELPLDCMEQKCLFFKRCKCKECFCWLCSVVSQLCTLQKRLTVHPGHYPVNRRANTYRRIVTRNGGNKEKKKEWTFKLGGHHSCDNTGHVLVFLGVSDVVIGPDFHDLKCKVFKQHFQWVTYSEQNEAGDAVAHRQKAF